MFNGKLIPLIRKQKFRRLLHINEKEQQIINNNKIKGK